MFLAYKRGDDGAKEDLAALMIPIVETATARKCSVGMDREDFFQELFIKLWRLVDEKIPLDKAHTALGYLLSCVNHKTIEVHRETTPGIIRRPGRSKNNYSEVVYELLPNEPACKEHGSRREWEEAFEELVLHCEDERAVVILIYNLVGGYSQEEIGERFGIKQSRTSQIVKELCEAAKERGVR